MSNKDYLEKLYRQVADCQKCSLYKSATNSVPGAGNPEAEIVFIGEAPGFFEDKKGLPFVGNSGHLLDKLLAEIGLERKKVYIANILKHRPPQNRDPLPEEIKVCTPFLKKQLLIIKPKIVITLGRFAMNYFIPNGYISHLHGKRQQITWEGINLLVYPVYHPSAGLRNGQMMQSLREDFLLIPSIIDELKKEKIEKSQSVQTKPEQEKMF
jgi:uracil-DNA glycosylase